MGAIEFFVLFSLSFIGVVAKDNSNQKNQKGNYLSDAAII
jgi:hypothetical protein